MAKGKKKITRVSKPKKKWFTALAPEIFKGLELGELPAFEAKNLPGRHIGFSYNIVTGSPRDSHKKAVYAERLREDLFKSVKLRLRSDVPLGIYISGGVDSSIITSIVNTAGISFQIPSQLAAFTLN